MERVPEAVGSPVSFLTVLYKSFPARLSFQLECEFPVGGRFYNFASVTRASVAPVFPLGFRRVLSHSSATWALPVSPG